MTFGIIFDRLRPVEGVYGKISGCGWVSASLPMTTHDDEGKQIELASIPSKKSLYFVLWKGRSALKRRCIQQFTGQNLPPTTGCSHAKSPS